MGHKMAKEDVGDHTLNDYLSMTAKIRYNTFKKNTFEQHSFSIYTGGALDKGFSYFAEMYLHENSGKVNANEANATDFSDYGRSKLAEAFLQYTYGDENVYTTARFGQILSQLLYIGGTGGRLGKDRSMALTSGVGLNPYRPFQRNYGLEVSHFHNGITGTLGVVNGTGGKLFNMVDDNGNKDFFATLDYEFDKEGSIVGFYAYQGIATLSTRKDHFYQFGPMFNYMASRFTLSGMALFGSDRQPQEEERSKSVAAYIEGGFKAYKELVTPYLRLDYFESKFPGQGRAYGPVAGVVWAPFSWGRFVGEGTVIKQQGAEDQKFSIEAQYMF